MIIILTACEGDEVIDLLSINTISVSGITSNSGISGGSFQVEGNIEIFIKGSVWSSEPIPTIADNFTNNGSGLDLYISELDGLNSSAQYYVRAYAITNIGVIYGNEVTFTTLEFDEADLIVCDNDVFNNSLNYGSVTDIDGNNYKTIEIGTQEWMAENLRTTKYRNGDPIPNVSEPEEWKELESGAWVYMHNDDDLNCPFGKLYNWHVVADSRGICPSGWHVPSLEEWDILRDFLDPEADGDDNVAGSKMKSVSLDYWNSPNDDATNESGFSAVPGGAKSWAGGIGSSFGYNDFWWSSTGFDLENFPAWYSAVWRAGVTHQSGVFFTTPPTSVGNGYSIRCIKD